MESTQIQTSTNGGDDSHQDPGYVLLLKDFCAWVVGQHLVLPQHSPLWRPFNVVLCFLLQQDVRRWLKLANNTRLVSFSSVCTKVQYRHIKVSCQWFHELKWTHVCGLIDVVSNICECCLTHQHITSHFRGSSRVLQQVWRNQRVHGDEGPDHKAF